MYALHDMHTVYKVVQCRYVCTKAGMETDSCAQARPSPRHLLTANENLNVSVLSKASKDKTHHV